MKIVMVVNNLEVSGGYQKLVIRLAQQLAKMGHDVTTYTPTLDTKNCYPKDIKTIKIESLDKPEQVGTVVDRYEKLMSKVDDDFDALIIHDELSLIAAALLPYRQSIWMLNNQLPEELGKYTVELKALISQKHLKLKDRLKDTKEGARRIRLMRRGLQRTDHFATYDSFNQQMVKKYLNRAADIVYAGADLERYKKLASDRQFNEKPVYQILSVGVIFPHRRYEDLIKATALINKDKRIIKTVIVGRQDLSPDYFDSLRKLVEKEGVSKSVQFLNYVSDDEMAKLYKTSDAFAFINDGFTWGISVFEAIAAKLPVIITSNIGAVDLVKKDKYGWIVEPRSPSQLAKAIKEIIDNRSNAKKIADDAYDDVADFVSWEAYAKRMLELVK